MEEAERNFWQWLELRICREFAGFEDSDLRSNWCDGLVPEEYDLESEQPAIRGTAYCGHSGQERWQFMLLIGNSVDSPADIDWPSLLPADDVTGWLSPHPPRPDIDPGPVVCLSRLTCPKHCHAVAP